MTAEHPFAQYIRILGKGPHLSRPLTQDETRAAARMVMAGEVEPVQLGAFLCLMRVKTETPEELAGWIEGVHDSLAVPAGAPAVDLSWASYAGKSRRLPWFLLSALLLADTGVRVFMHGTEGHTGGRVYTRAALQSLGIVPARSLAEAAERIARDNFAYLPLAALSPRLHDILGLKPLLGLRSPIHTVARSLNPFGADHAVVSVFHPPYRAVHQQAGRLCGQQNLAVFKGEGGEVERRPEKPCVVDGLAGGAPFCEEWPPLPVVPPPDWDDMTDLGRLRAVWRGETSDAYAEATVTSTVAVLLRLLGRTQPPDALLALAERLWADRRRDRVPGA